MGIPTLVRQHFYIETTHWSILSNRAIAPVLVKQNRGIVVNKSNVYTESANSYTTKQNWVYTNEIYCECSVAIVQLAWAFMIIYPCDVSW